MPEGNTDTTIERQNESLPSLFGRLADELTQLFDAKLDLLQTELKEELKAYSTGALLILAGGVIAMVGFALLNVAIAFLISVLFEATHWSPAAKYGVGFVITALAYLVIGGIIVMVAKNRLAKQSIVPKRSAMEFRRDKEWLKERI